jgi:hypothetical protein
MPERVVDLSARSEVIRDEPWHLHFWEITPDEVLDYLRDPRGFLASFGVDLPEDCRIETVIENHDWLARQTKGLASADGTIICNVGTGNIAKAVYRVAMYAHHRDDIGRHDKRLLHDPGEEAQASA